MKPLILINFKTYPEASGEKALALAREIAGVQKDKYELVVAPSLLMAREVAAQAKVAVFAQHTDPFLSGAYTGHIVVDELQDAGIKGTLLNHAERKIMLPAIKNTIDLCRKKKLKTVVCASSLAEVKKIAVLKPDYLAYEPPELIGGNLSVTKARPEVILKAVELVKSLSPSTKVLCGAGIQSKEDIGQALLLGMEGVLIAHAVVKSKNPGKFLGEMLV